MFVYCFRLLLYLRNLTSKSSEIVQEQSCIMEIIIFLFRYKHFAIHGKQISVPVVHEIHFGGA